MELKLHGRQKLWLNAPAQLLDINFDSGTHVLDSCWTSLSNLDMETQGWVQLGIVQTELTITDLHAAQSQAAARLAGQIQEARAKFEVHINQKIEQLNKLLAIAGPAATSEPEPELELEPETPEIPWQDDYECVITGFQLDVNNAEASYWGDLWRAKNPELDPYWAVNARNGYGQLNAISTNKPPHPLHGIARKIQSRPFYPSTLLFVQQQDMSLSLEAASYIDQGDARHG